MLVAVAQGGAQHFIGRVLAAAVGPFALELPGGVAAGLADDAAGGHQRLHVQVVGGHGAVQVRRAQRGHIFAKDLVQLVRGGVLQPLMQGAQVQVFQGVGGVGGLAHAHDAHPRARPRGHQVARVAGRAHREADVRKAADDLADGQQNPRAAGALQLVEGRAGKGIGAVLGVVLAVAQHQRARAVLGGAHLHDAAAAFGQGVERGARHRAGPVRAGKRHVDHRVALGGEVDAQRAHLLDHGVGVAVLHGLVGKEGGEQLFLHKLAARVQAAAHEGHVLAGAALLGEARGDAVEHLLELLGGHGLEQIFLHAQGDGLARVGEIVVSRQDHHADPRHLALDLAAQLHAVHEGHADVGDEDVRVGVADHGQGDFAVRGFPDQRVAAFLPGKGIADALADHDFIVHQKDLNHPRSPLLSCGARGSSRGCPPVRFRC